MNPIVNDTFTMGFILCWKRTRTAGESLGSEGSAAGGRYSDPSEWQRSTKSRKSVSPKILSGTATGGMVDTRDLKCHSEL